MRLNAVISTVMFTWIGDDEPLFAAPARGVEAAVGWSTVRRLRQRRQRAGRDRRRRSSRPPRLARPVELRDAQDTRARLEAAGFTDVWTWLQPGRSSSTTRARTSRRRSSAHTSTGDRRPSATFVDVAWPNRRAGRRRLRPARSARKALSTASTRSSTLPRTSIHGSALLRKRCVIQLRRRSSSR